MLAWYLLLQSIFRTLDYYYFWQATQILTLFKNMKSLFFSFSKIEVKRKAIHVVEIKSIQTGENPISFSETVESAKNLCSVHRTEECCMKCKFLVINPKNINDISKKCTANYAISLFMHNERTNRSNSSHIFFFWSSLSFRV